MKNINEIIDKDPVFGGIKTTVYPSAGESLQAVSKDLAWCFKVFPEASAEDVFKLAKGWPLEIEDPPSENTLTAKLVKEVPFLGKYINPKETVIGRGKFGINKKATKADHELLPANFSQNLVGTNVKIKDFIEDIGKMANERMGDKKMDYGIIYAGYSPAIKKALEEEKTKRQERLREAREKKTPTGRATASAEPSVSKTVPKIGLGARSKK
jgi:hypothetical protein